MAEEMSMKLSNRKLLNVVPSLNELNKLKLPVKTSYRLAKLSRKVESALKDYQKTLESLQDKHAERDDEGEKVVTGNTIKFVDDVAFKKEFDELLEFEADVDTKKISLNDFGSVEVEPSFLYHLDWLIKE
jgi:hypothetical protein